MMAPTISTELLELAASMDIDVTPYTFEDELRKLILSSKVLPEWMHARARAEGAKFPRGASYETALIKLGEVIIKNGGHRAGMVLLHKGGLVRIVGINFGGGVILGGVVQTEDGWEPTNSPTATVYVTELDNATVIFSPPII